MMVILGMIGIVIFIGLMSISWDLIEINKTLEKIKDKL
jgi:hypothetical protein